MFVMKTELSTVKYTNFGSSRKKIFPEFSFVLMQVGRLLNENVSIYKFSFLYLPSRHYVFTPSLKTVLFVASLINGF